MHILMASSEMAPLAKTGGLGDVLGALPKGLARLGHKVTLVLPFYRTINAEKYGINRYGDWFVVQMSGRQVFGGLHVWEPHPGVTVYLVAQDELYGRDGIYGDKNGGFGDNHLRYIFLSLATLEVARRLDAAGNPPDVFHGHDWHVGLVPVYLREGRLGRRLPSVFSIHNLQYQGRYGQDVLYDAGLNLGYMRSDLLELYGTASFMKAGLVFSDLISTVSRAYAREILTPEHGHGLDGLLRARVHDLVGIINGIDADVWNPSTDTLLPARFSSQDMSGKDLCKRALQQEFGLPVRPDVPLLAIVSRLVEQKGISLVAQVLPRLLTQDIQLVVLGSGEHRYQDMFEQYRAHAPYQVGVEIGFDEALAHRIEAGADMFLMPSHFEPCGLNQLYSLRYGTVPIVRAVGGLDDTVHDFDPRTGRGNGFKFEHYDANGFSWAIGRALRLYQNRDYWNHLRRVSMDDDFSWETAAQKYVDLYERAIDA